MNQKILTDARIGLHALILALAGMEATRYLSIVKTEAERVRMRIGKLMQLEGFGSPYQSGYDKDSKTVEPMTDAAVTPFQLEGETTVQKIKHARSRFAELRQMVYNATLNDGVASGVDMNRHFKQHCAFSIQQGFDDITNFLGCELGENAKKEAASTTQNTQPSSMKAASSTSTNSEASGQEGSGQQGNAGAANAPGSGAIAEDAGNTGAAAAGNAEGAGNTGTADAAPGNAEGAGNTGTADTAPGSGADATGNTDSGNAGSGPAAE